MSKKLKIHDGETQGKTFEVKLEYPNQKGTKMSDMKCPFCKEEIISDLCFTFNKKDRDYTDGRQIYKCNKCGLFGKKELWQELIRTRKALDVAVDELKRIDETRSRVKENLHATNGRTLNEGNGFCWATIDEVHNALEQITTLNKGASNE